MGCNPTHESYSIRGSARRSVATGWAQYFSPGYLAQAQREVNWYVRDRLADRRGKQTVLYEAAVGARVIPLARVHSHDFHQQHVAGYTLSNQKVVGIDRAGLS